nr:MAG TPA_asm: hypothetical protein [Caudoviricetes sp.]
MVREIIFTVSVFLGGYMCRVAWEDYFNGEEEEEE